MPSNLDLALSARAFHGDDADVVKLVKSVQSLLESAHWAKYT